MVGKTPDFVKRQKGIICNSSNWSLLLKNQGRRVGPTHQRVSRAGRGWGGHSQWLWEDPAERGRGGSESPALTVKSGSGAANLWSLGWRSGRWMFPQRGGLRVRPGFQLGTWVGGAVTEPGSPHQQSGRSHQAFLGPGGWGPGASPLGGNRKAHRCWHQAASCPTPDETCHTTADTQAPETTRTPGQAATEPRRMGHPCRVCEPGSPFTTPADVHPPERTRGSL